MESIAKVIETLLTPQTLFVVELLTILMLMYKMYKHPRSWRRLILIILPLLWWMVYNITVIDSTAYGIYTVISRLAQLVLCVCLVFLVLSNE